MDFDIHRIIRRIIDLAPVWILMILGMWLVILQPLGPRFTLIPGDLGDARFVNYILEHFFLWINGLVKDYWNAPFFYPFGGTMAFGDNLLGSAPFYALMRWMGLDMASAYQGWYAFGSLLNYVAAGYVLSRLKLKPLATGIGAFFYAFGLPVLAQENHAQLLYHFCVPLACYSLWQLYQKMHLRYLVSTITFTVWQFFLTIYIGIFLVFLLVILAVLLPFFVEAKSLAKRLTVWPRSLRESWSIAHPTGRILTVVSITALGMGFLALVLRYYQISRIYGFHRNWTEVSSMLPRWWSFLLSDFSQLWGPLSKLFTDLPLRWEHQLFPGLSVILLILVGIIFHFRSENNRLAWLHFGAAFGLILLTLDISGFSFYQLIWKLPGMNSIRAVGRIFLVIMWPLSLFIAWVVDGILRQQIPRNRWRLAAAYLITGLLVAESVFYTHYRYDKTEANARLESLRQQIPAQLPADPILSVAMDRTEPFFAREIDAMLLAQQLGWPTLNGYSGNSPPGYASADSCKRLPQQIKQYMDFAKISDPSFYLGTMQRVVPIGFTDCDLTWWEEMP